MNHFLYFLPGENSPGGVIEKYGLQYAFDAEKAPNTIESVGPDGKRGLLVSYAEPDELKYESEKQIWIPFGHLYVGAARDAMPTAEDIQRLQQVNGYMIPLADGYTWHVPLARELPKQITFNTDGAVVQSPMERYADLCRDAERVFYHIKRDLGYLEEGDPNEHIQIDEAAHIVINILAVNYRLGKPEATLLKLLDTQAIHRAMMYFSDVISIVEVAEARAKAAKKNAEETETKTSEMNAGDDSGSGETDS